MFLGRVKGHIVATAKDPAIKGRKLLVIEPLKVAYDDPDHAANATGGEAGEAGADGSGGDARSNRPPAKAGSPIALKSGGGRFEVTGRAIVAMDTLGAGEGQLVLIVQGSSARMAEGCSKTPTDAVVVGIVDEAVVMGEKIG